MSLKKKYKVKFVSPKLRAPEEIPYEILADGPKVQELEEAVAEYLGAKHVIATSSGTMALYTVFRGLGLRLANIAMPAYTWRSTAETAIMAGAKPTFFDIDETLCLDVEVITSHKFCDYICVNDCFGCPADYENLKASGISFFSDSASAFGAKYRGKKLGSEGIHCFSLSPTKNLTANEGGLIVCDDIAFAREFKLIRRWAGRMTEFNAACALEGLKYLDETLIRKKEIAFRYRKFAIGQGWQVQEVPGDRETTWKDIIIILPSMQERDGLQYHLEVAGIETRVYFTPAPKFLEDGQYYAGDLTKTKNIQKRSLCLPCWVGVDQGFVIKVMQEFCNLSEKQLQRVQESSEYLDYTEGRV